MQPEYTPTTPCLRCGGPRTAYLQPTGKQADVRRKRQWTDAHPGQSAESARLWQSEHPERAYARTLRWQQAHPERTRLSKAATRIVLRAIKDGKLVRPDSCEACGISGIKPDAAHADYSKPLEVRWLCRKCHGRWDADQPKTISHG